MWGPILLRGMIHCKGNNIFPKHIKIWKKKYKMRK